MNKRPSRAELYLHIAWVISSRATCNRGRVGAVITRDNRIISTGYNGPLRGEEECENICDIQRPCARSIHAEANAIASAAKHGISLEGAILYCTHAPCLKCAELIIQSGITTVQYLNDYRDFDGVELLERNKVIHLKTQISYTFYEPTQDNNHIQASKEISKELPNH